MRRLSLAGVRGRGLASFAATVEFMPEIVWAKLDALAEGARRASERLWS